MLGGLAAISGIICVIALVTSAVFMLVRRLGGGGRLAIVISGLFFPIFVLLVGGLGVIYGQDVDGPPPGMVLMGLLTMSVAITPVTFLLSFILARVAARTIRRNVR